MNNTQFRILIKLFELLFTMILELSVIQMQDPSSITNDDIDDLTEIGQEAQSLIDYGKEVSRKH